MDALVSEYYIDADTVQAHIRAHAGRRYQWWARHGVDPLVNWSAVDDALLDQAVLLLGWDGRARSPIASVTLSAPARAALANWALRNALRAAGWSIWAKELSRLPWDGYLK